MEVIRRINAKDNKLNVRIHEFYCVAGDLRAADRRLRQVRLAEDAAGDLRTARGAKAQAQRCNHELLTQQSHQEQLVHGRRAEPVPQSAGTPDCRGLSH